jgi:hypothetical protein
MDEEVICDHLENRARQLEDSLRVAVDDLYKAANQFDGINPNGMNCEIFTNKAKRAEKVLKNNE